uniref:Homing endonuclease LAGLIDADG domain-containing protein n=2 Tax=Alexandrium monilatum TaxID=311494 RepID=A0A7S4Q792_9DINO
MKRLKRSECAALDAAARWEYLAGLVDAEGCIRVAGTSGIRLEIAQKQLPILSFLAAWLADSIPGCTPRVYRKRGAFALRVHTLAANRRIFERLLDAGLLQKREAAEIAMSYTRESHAECRQRLAPLVGNQARYSRLDAAGCARAQELARLRSRVYRRQEIDAAVGLVQRLRREIDVLAQQHAAECALARVGLLRRDIRSLLRRGASRAALPGRVALPA